MLDTMGKNYKTQPKLHLERRKTISQTGEGTETEPEKIPEVTTHEDQDLRHILAAMQQSLTEIDGKIDTLSYCMDRMSEHLNKQAERLDQAERWVSAVEDGQTALATGQLKVSTELGTLRHKMDDLESHSQRNKLCIVGIAESTSIANMENFIENLLIQLLGQDTFSVLFVVERAHRSLLARPPPEAPPHPLEQEHRDTADVRTLGHIRAKLQEFQERALSEVRHMGKYAVARAYGEGDRPGKVLANLIRPSRSTNLTNKAVAADGIIIGDPESVATRFREYYQTLYTTRGGPDPNAIRDCHSYCITETVGYR
ncbi:hypothetical protein NDU88_004290 [Pleurodeles waltl]|uniref:Uncharacterized protein n=1 Tax=Pleurodeles waltl TaxID=8319 RepID=A0AAV7L107_PLEWA|nr:hypothetical protein NDU88_004290 [Pleurodeles waltl]